MLERDGKVEVVVTRGLLFAEELPAKCIFTSALVLIINLLNLLAIMGEVEI